MTAAKKIWSASWRIAVGALLLLWIFHSIFVNEARELGKRGELIHNGTRVVWTSDDAPPRMEQWRYGWKYGPPALGHTLSSVQPGWLALSFALMGATLVIGIARWRLVLRVQGLPLPFNRAAEISLVAHFFNSFLLGTAGGDVMKAYCAARETANKKTEAVVTVFVDRVIGLWAMLLFATIMITPNLARVLEPTYLRSASAVTAAMTLAASGFVFLAFRGGVSRTWSGARAWLRRLPKGEWLERSLESCRKFGNEPGFVRKTLAMSMTLNFLCVLQFLVLAKGLRMDVPLTALCLVVPTVICISALPIAPSGLGVREYLFVQLLSAAVPGVDPTDALSLSLLAFAGSLFWSLMGGVVYTMFKHQHHLDEIRAESKAG